MRRLKIILVSLFLFFMAFSLASANEGTFTLKSRNNYDYWCYGASIKLLDGQFHILLSCRNLIFPVEETLVKYVAWVQPVENESPIKLGDIGLGRIQYQVGVPFSTIFISTETNPKNAKVPSDNIVMTGVIEGIESPYISSTDQDPEDEEKLATEEEESLTPTPTITARGRIVTGLKRAALVSLLAVISLIGLIFVLTRNK